MKVYKNTKGGWQFNFTLDRKQHQIYLGKNHNAASAARVGDLVQELLLCRYRSQIPSVKVMAQVKHFDSKLLASIRRHGILSYCDSGLTMGALLDDFMEQKRDLAESTLATYRSHLKTIRKFFGGKTIVTDIDVDRGLAFRLHLLDEDYAPVTVGWTIRVVRSMFHFGVKQRLCLENPFEDIYPGPKSNDNNYRYIDPQVIETISNRCKKRKWPLPFASLAMPVCGCHRKFAT